MQATEIDLNMYRRTAHTDSVTALHSEIMRNLQEIGPPFGLAGMTAPSVPDFGADVVTGYSIKYSIPGIHAEGVYKYRKDGYNVDHAAFDDALFIQFKVPNKRLDYHSILHVHFPTLVSAFGAYRAFVGYGFHALYYCGGAERTNPTYNRLLADKSINVDGRNNIFTLEPAIYWDALLCKRALGYDRDEVIRRLNGQVAKVMPLMDGVYTVFNDDPNLSYEEFVAINNRFKPILGLV
jgi:hypothetical protein